MARSWTAAPSPSTSLAHAKNVWAEAEAVVVVANLAADAVAVAAVAVAAIATKSRNVIIRRGSGKPSPAFFVSEFMNARRLVFTWLICLSLVARSDRLVLVAGG